MEKDKLLEMTREDLERQHTEMLTAVREEYTRHITQLQHVNKVTMSFKHRDGLLVYHSGN